MYDCKTIKHTYTGTACIMRSWVEWGKKKNRTFLIRVLVIALMLSALIVPEITQAADSNLSVAQYSVREVNRRVLMRDGIELAVRIIGPDVDGKFPAIMGYNPYRSIERLEAAASDLEYSNFANAPHYLAERGYIVVNYDVRGTGSSGGSSKEMYSDAERQDGYDMVEWIADQPWSNGNVGMWGMSYGAVVTWQIAAMAPPHLKAVIIRSGTEDPYNDWTYPGGLPRSLFIHGNYGPSMAASNFAPPDPELTGHKWAEVWKEHLENNVPWSIGFLRNQVDGPYWRARSVRPDYERVKAAVFLIGGWADWYFTPALRAFEKLEVPKRVLIGPWDHSWPEDALPGPRIDGRVEYLKWFDKYLKNIDTGVDDEPPVTIFVRQYQPPMPTYEMDAGFFRHENEWPIARAENVSMFLGPGELLNQQSYSRKNEDPDGDSITYKPSVGAMSGIVGRGTIGPWAMPLDQRPDEAFSLNYTTAPLDEELEVTGTPRVNLFVSSTAEVAYFHVRVADVAPDGTSKLVTDGGLNATHRDSRTEPEQLTPGTTYELDFGLKAMAYVFPAGHRIRMSISSADFQNVWPISMAAVNKVFKGEEFPSKIVLPVVPPQNPALPEPNLQPSPVPISPADLEPKPTHEIIKDLINQTTTVRTENPEGTVTASFRVSDADPANAVLKGVNRYEASLPEGGVVVNAQTVTTSDKDVFRHIVIVEIEIDGKRYFNKSWTVSVPRVLN